MAKYLDMPGLTFFYNSLKDKFAYKTDIGSPLKASTKADMTDSNRVYIYTGSEQGMEHGHWYYKDNNTWIDGGIYNSAAVQTDAALENSGVPADAKATGDGITDLRSTISHTFHLINYGYDTPQSRSPVANATDSTIIGYSRVGQIITLNGGPLNKDIIVKINGTVSTTVSSSTVQGWIASVELEEDHEYRLTLKRISGSVSHASNDFPVTVSLYRSGQSSSIGTRELSDDGVTVELAATGNGGMHNICIYIAANTTLTNAKYFCTLEDITESPFVSKEDFDTEIVDIKNILTSENLTNIYNTTTIYTKTTNAVTNNNDGTYTIGTGDYGTIIFGSDVTVSPGKYILYGVEDGFSFLSTTTNYSNSVVRNYTNSDSVVTIENEATLYLGFRNASAPSESYAITPYLLKRETLVDTVSELDTRVDVVTNDVDDIKDSFTVDINDESIWQVGGLGSDGSNYSRNTSIRTKTYLDLSEYDYITTSSEFVSGYLALYSDANVSSFLIRLSMKASKQYNVSSYYSSYPTATKFRIEIGGVDGDLTSYDLIGFISNKRFDIIDNKIKDIKDELDTKSSAVGTNLIGPHAGHLYPVDGIGPGSYLCVATSDGSTVSSSVPIRFYNSNRVLIDYYNLLYNNSYRVIGPLSSAYSDVKYISQGTATAVPLMINLGSSRLSYVPYYETPTQLTDEVYDLWQETSITTDVTRIHAKEKDAVTLLTRYTDGSTFSKNAVTALWVSDIHNEQTRTSRMVSLLNNWGSGYFDIAINTGDTTAALQTEGVAWYDTIIAGSSIPVLNTVGNHDAWTQLGGPNASATDVYEMLIAPVANNTSIVQPSNAATYGLNYYYKDVNGVRIVILDCMYWDIDQLTWFEDVLESARIASYPVMVGIHYPFYTTYRTMLDTPWNTGVPNSGSANWSSDISMADAVKTFVGNGGEFICWLQGHSHWDRIFKLHDYGDQLCVQITSFTNRDSYPYKSSDKSMYTYDALTILTVDTYHHVVKFYRIGADINLAGEKYKSFAWDYHNNVML